MAEAEFVLKWTNRSLIGLSTILPVNSPFYGAFKKSIVEALVSMDPYRYMVHHLTMDANIPIVYKKTLEEMLRYVGG